MKLAAYILEGTPISDITTGYNPADLSGNPAYKVFEGNTPAGYSDISSIENWDKYGVILIGSAVNFMDWKCLRSAIKALANSITTNDIPGNWGLFSSVEKQLVCKYLTNKVSAADFIATYTSQTDRVNISLNFDKLSIEARTQRYYRMWSFAYGRFGSLNVLDFLNHALRDGDRVGAYIAGIETKADDGVDALLDMIDGTTGTIYIAGAADDLKGLRHRTYTIVDGSGDTIADVCDHLLDIASGLY